MFVTEMVEVRVKRCDFCGERSGTMEPIPGPKGTVYHGCHREVKDSVGVSIRHDQIVKEWVDVTQRVKEIHASYTLSSNKE